MTPIFSNLDALQMQMLVVWGITVTLLVLGLAALINCRLLSSRRWRRWAPLRDFLFSADLQQRTLFLRYMVGFLNGMAGVLALNFGVQRGAIDAEDARLLTWGAVLVGGGWLVVMRTGWNMGFKDRSLTEPQMMSTILFLGWGYVLGGPGREVALMLLFMILMFSMFRVTTAQMVRCSLLSMAVFGAAFLKVADMQRHVPYESEMQAVYFAVLVIILISMCLLMTSLANMRSRSHQRKIELSDALARIQELAIRDELTGLYNRRHMLEMLNTERSRAERSGHPWSICMIDLDLFKQVNDHHGHNVGDEVLASVAQVIREGLRDSDQVARWGGEEFLILFPSTDATEAKIVLERIRLALRSTGVSRSVPELKVTFSAGVAACQSGDSLPVSIDRADRALYLAKASGRNRTEVALPATPSASEPLLAVR